MSQNVPFTTALYWAITTATTVGYGDVTPHKGAGRVIASAVMLTTIPLLAAVFALVTGAAAVAGIRRILNVEDRFPAGTYRVILGMSRGGELLHQATLSGTDHSAPPNRSRTYAKPKTTPAMAAARRRVV